MLWPFFRDVSVYVDVTDSHSPSLGAIALKLKLGNTELHLTTRCVLQLE